MRFGMHVLYANALPRAFRERHEPFVQLHALLTKPALRNEFLWRGKEGWIAMGCPEAFEDDCLTVFKLGQAFIVGHLLCL